MTTKQREDHWRQIVGRQAKSGFSVKAFCRQENLCAHTLYIWRKRFSRQRPVRFVEVKPEVRQPSSGLELLFSSGERLQIPAGVDAPTLRTVIAVLRERA